MIWYEQLLTVCLCCGYSLKETADFTFSAHDMFLEFYFFAIINVLYMYTVSDCHEKAIIKSMQFIPQRERLLYNIIGFEPTKWTIYLPLLLSIAILF
jgi:hypothetical protein